MVSLSNPTDFASRVQTYYNPKLLEALKYNLQLARFGLQGKYPAAGATPTIRFFRPRLANTVGTGPLTEGTVPTNLTEVAVGYVDVPLTQRGALAKVTDIVLATDLLDTVKLYTQTMGADAALDLDTVTRNTLVAGLNNSNATYTGYFERFAGTANTGNSANDFASMSALSSSSANMTRAENIKCITQLKSARVPKIAGKYVCIVPPAIIHDLRKDTTLTLAFQYQGEPLYKDQVVMLDGVVFIEATNPFQETAYGTFAAGGKVFTSIYLGDAAFGVPGLDNAKAGGSPFAPQLIIINKPDHYNPLAQFIQIGWKAFYGAKPLITNESWESPRFVLFRSQTTFQ
jgi:N4-gp56 family major capsid protein